MKEGSGYLKYITFWSMPIKQKILFFINFFLCGVARASINLFSYKQLSPYFGNSCRMLTASTIASKEQIQQARCIKRSIQLVVRYTPWNSNCLTQAMVVKFWCQYYRIPYLFFIGFSKKTQKPLGEEAHAWVTVGPVAVSGGYGFMSHHVVLSYSNQTIMSDK